MANYKHIKITDKDPFVLMEILALPNSNDLSDYVDRGNHGGSKEDLSSHYSSSQRRGVRSIEPIAQKSPTTSQLTHTNSREAANSLRPYQNIAKIGSL